MRGALCDHRVDGPLATRPELVTCSRCLTWPDRIRDAFGRDGSKLVAITRGDFVRRLVLRAAVEACEGARPRVAFCVACRRPIKVGARGTVPRFCRPPRRCRAAFVYATDVANASGKTPIQRMQADRMARLRATVEAGVFPVRRAALLVSIHERWGDGGEA